MIKERKNLNLIIKINKKSQACYQGEQKFSPLKNLLLKQKQTNN